MESGGSPGSPDAVDMTDKEFQQYFEKDVGVTFYKYVPKNQDPEHNMGEIYILQTSDDAKYQLKTNDVLPFDSNKISCPYCIKLIEKAEKLFIDEPSDKQKELAGVCSHCRRTFAKMKKPFHSSTKSGKGSALDYLRAQMLEADKKDRQRQNKYFIKGSNSLKEGPRDKDKGIEDKHLKKKQISPKTLERPLQSIHESDEEQEKKRKTKGKRHEDIIEKNEGEEKLKSKRKKQQDPGKEIDGKSKDPLTSKDDALVAIKNRKKSKSTGHLLSKDDVSAENQDGKKSRSFTEKGEKLLAKDNKTGKPKEKGEKTVRKSPSAELLLAQIAQEKLKKQEAEDAKKELEKLKKERELAEKRAKEAEARLKRLKSDRSTSRILPSDSEESIKERVTSSEPLVEDIIVGEKIYKIKRKRAEIGVDETAKSPMNKLKTTDRASAVKSKGLQQELSSQRQDKTTSGTGAGSEKLRKGGDGTQIPHIGSIVETKPTDKTRVGSVKYGKADKAVPDPGTKNKTEDSEGIIRFNLSDPTFIDKGWTMLPLEKVVRKMNIYRMRPAKPEFDWFEHNKGKLLQYSSGEKLAELDQSGRGRVYYRKGDLALDYYNAEETNAGRRFVVYSTGAPDENGRPRPKTVLATFDHCGNGIVYDHNGKTRLKYNQTEGVILDRKLGPVSNWKWHALNDPPLLQQVMIDTQLDHKIPQISKMDAHETPKIDDEAMLAIELDNLMKEKTKKVQQTFKPFQIKMKAMKINENFSLKVVDQETVYLLFRDGTTNLKFNIGMELDTKEILDTDISEIGDVSNKMDELPACTASIAELQKQVAQARAAENRRAASIRRWYLPKASVDVLRSGISRPLRTPVVACSVCASKSSKASCGCYNYIS